MAKDNHQPDKDPAPDKAHPAQPPEPIPPCPPMTLRDGHKTPEVVAWKAQYGTP